LCCNLQKIKRKNKKHWSVECRMQWQIYLQMLLNFLLHISCLLICTAAHTGWKGSTVYIYIYMCVKYQVARNSSIINIHSFFFSILWQLRCVEWCIC
jgi:hypothetical protein